MVTCNVETEIISKTICCCYIKIQWYILHFQWLLLLLLFSCSVVSSSWRPHGLKHTRLPCPSPSPQFTQTHVHWVGDANLNLLYCLLLLLPSISPSIRVFSNESVLRIRRPKYWNFSFSISPSNEYSGLISFRMDWLDLLAVQETLKNFLQHQS